MVWLRHKSLDHRLSHKFNRMTIPRDRDSPNLFEKFKDKFIIFFLIEIYKKGFFYIIQEF